MNYGGEGMTTKTKEYNPGWRWDNSYARLPDLFFTMLEPTPVRSPKLAVLNERLAESLGLNVDMLRREEAVEVFAGNRVPDGAEPLSQAYAGHQFGHFTMLGDGRAILLGEQLTARGERVDIQLKGSGRTPYSRGGDGRAALGPMLREYIISEAMHALGIPTTRSLAVVTTGEPVYRESVLPGAILTRTAASHIRVGTFQYAARWGTVEELRALADYTWERHFADKSTDEHEFKDVEANRYLSLYREAIRRQAQLIAKWQLVGFIHGVMNTDNMALSGETIDYGPCAFMDHYDPSTVFSSIDTHGRYAYGHQPQIAAWNLARLAEAMLPLFHHDEDEAVRLAEEALSEFQPLFQKHWLAGMRAKLGLFGEEAEDEALVQDLLDLMRQHGADYTNTFLALTYDQLHDSILHGMQSFSEWTSKWRERQNRHSAEHHPSGQQDKAEKKESASQRLMRSSNPAVIPRNHRVEEALKAAVERGDYSVMERLLDALSEPYAHRPEQAEYAILPEQPDRCYRTFCGT